MYTRGALTTRGSTGTETGRHGTGTCGAVRATELGIVPPRPPPPRPGPRRIEANTIEYDCRYVYMYWRPVLNVVFVYCVCVGRRCPSVFTLFTVYVYTYGGLLLFVAVPVAYCLWLVLLFVSRAFMLCRAVLCWAPSCCRPVVGCYCFVTLGFLCRAVWAVCFFLAGRVGRPWVREVRLCLLPRLRLRRARWRRLCSG
jgi:hypothetical protein